MIYFLQRANGDVKIGTTIGFYRRSTELRAQHGELELLGIMSGSRETEREVHLLFADLRDGKTEFFRCADRLLQYIEQNTMLEIPKSQDMTARIAVSPKRLSELRDFCRGAGMTYDEALEYLLQHIQQVNESALETGLRLHGDIQRSMTEVPS